MDIVNVSEQPCFIFAYIMQLYIMPDNLNDAVEKQQYRDISYTEIESRLYKSKEDAVTGSKIALQQYQTSHLEFTESKVHIFKAFSVWDAEQKHVTVLETQFHLGCKMPLSAIPDHAKGYSLGYGAKNPIVVLEKLDRKSNEIKMTSF